MQIIYVFLDMIVALPAWIIAFQKVYYIFNVFLILNHKSLSQDMVTFMIESLTASFVQQIVNGLLFPVAVQMHA